MGQNIEEILDKALTELSRGKTVAEVVSEFPEHQADELAALLEVASMGLSIPRNIVPTPLRRRAFAQELHRSWWLRSASIVKFGIMPLTLVLMALGVRTAIGKVQASLPNGPLYNVKRASEKLRLTFTRDTNDQAAFQLQLTQRRLDEVKLAAATNDPATEAAALAELKDQSQKTFATVPQVAVAKALANKDSSMLDSLVAINKQQQEVLTSIQTQPQTQSSTKEITHTALDTAKQTGLTLDSLVATVQEQTLVDLQNKISITGTAAIAQDKTKITIDNTTFSITKDTSITSSDGEQVDPAQLPTQFKANIVGAQIGTGYAARIISLIDNNGSGDSAKPAKTATPADKVPVKAVELKKTEAASPPAASQSQTDGSGTAPAADPNHVTSGVIVEPANPQYKP